MTEQEKLTAEKQELNLLIDRGMSFQVERTVYKRPKGIFSGFMKAAPEKEVLQFTIQEPTLSTLDRLSVEQIDIVIDEAALKSDVAISEAKKITHEHARRMARIIAIATMGQDYIKAVQTGARVKYERDNQKLDELTDLFLQYIKPSQLIQLTLMVNTMSNLGDFINSIRLMSAVRTTMPTLIEENKKD